MNKPPLLQPTNHQSNLLSACRAILAARSEVFRRKLGNASFHAKLFFNGGAYYGEYICLLQSALKFFLVTQHYTILAKCIFFTSS